MRWLAAARRASNVRECGCHRLLRKGPPVDSTDVRFELGQERFQVHGISEADRNVVSQKIRYAKLLAVFETLPHCVAGMKAYGAALQ